MDIKAPKGHTSISFTDYLRDNWPDFTKFMTAQGFNSFNSYANYVMTNDFNTNYADAMKQKHIAPNKSINPDSDTPTIWKEKLNLYTDGEGLDYFHLITDLRNTVIRDLKKRGVKL